MGNRDERVENWVVEGNLVVVVREGGKETRRGGFELGAMLVWARVTNHKCVWLV